MESNRVNSIISGRSPLYTYINHHVGTPKQKQTIIVILKFLGLKVPD